MASSKDFQLQTDPADFTVLTSAMFTVAEKWARTWNARLVRSTSRRTISLPIVSGDYELVALAGTYPC